MSRFPTCSIVAPCSHRQGRFAPPGGGGLRPTL